MHTIRFRLNLLFTLVITATLLGLGAYEHVQTRQRLLADYQRQIQVQSRRLAQTLPGPLWNFDRILSEELLRAEFDEPSLTAAVLLSDNGRQVLQRSATGVRLIDRDPEADQLDRVQAPLRLRGSGPFKETVIGHITLFYSREHMQQQLQTRLQQLVLQIFLLNVALLIALAQGFSRLVARPLASLQAALERAAGVAGAVNAADLRLPAERSDEFGAVTASYNRIVDKLSEELALRGAAEQTAVEARSRAEQTLSELQRTQRSLIEAEKLSSLGGLVAGIAHEINTPVGVTLTCASHLNAATKQLQQTLLQGGLKKSDLQGYVNDAAESCDLMLNNVSRAASLIQSFKQVAVDQTSEARRRFRLGDYLQEVVTSLRPRLKKAGVEVEIDCPADIELDSYPGLLAQVMTNLLMNSLIHAFDGMAGGAGRVHIGVQPIGQQVQIAVQDNGRGILPEHLPKLFDPFFTTRRGSGGSGLGLNIVYNIVRQQLGGNIGVVSQPGQGACFTLAIALTAPYPEESTHERQPG